MTKIRAASSGEISPLASSAKVCVISELYSLLSASATLARCVSYSFCSCSLRNLSVLSCGTGKDDAGQRHGLSRHTGAESGSVAGCLDRSFVPHSIDPESWSWHFSFTGPFNRQPEAHSRRRPSVPMNAPPGLGPLGCRHSTPGA